MPNTESSLVINRPPTGQQLARIAGKHGFGRADIHPMTATGVVNWIFALGDTAVLRVPNGEHPDAVRDALTESVAVPAALRAGIRAPRLLVFDDSRDIIDTLFTIYERVPGQDLASHSRTGREVSDRIYRDLGRELATLHRDVTEVSDPHGWLDEHPRFDGVRSASDLLHAGLLDAKAADTLTAVAQRVQPCLHQAAGFRRFLHQDVTLGNVMSRDDQFAALIDWGDAGWGDPAQEFADLPLPAVDHALAGYRDIMPLDGDETAEARILWDHVSGAMREIRRPVRPTYGHGHDDATTQLIDLIGFLLSRPGRNWLTSAGLD